MSLALAACGPGPEPQSPLGRIVVVPEFPAGAAGLVSVSAARLVLRGTLDGRIAADTVVGPGADSLDLDVTVPVFSASETFTLTLALADGQGDTIFRGGPVTLALGPARGGAAAVVVALRYTGTGATAARAVIVSAPDCVFFGEARTAVAVAVNVAGGVIPGTPIEWRSLDSARVRVPDPSVGQLAGNAERGAARVVARLLTGPADTVTVVAQPPPAHVLAESGDGQSGAPGTALPQRLVARVLAADGGGVWAVWVRFAVAAGGGALSADSVQTGPDGRAAVTFTLGSAGAQSVTASIHGVSGAAGFSASAGIARARHK